MFAAVLESENPKPNATSSHKPTDKFRKHLKVYFGSAIPKNKNCFLTVVFGGKVFQCIRQVMSVYCQNLTCNWETANKICISMPVISADAFSEAYNWMKSPKTYNIPRKYVIEVLKLAINLGIRALYNQCWLITVDVETILEEKAFLVYRECVRVGMRHMRGVYFMRITKFFLPLVASTDFLKLSADDVAALLNCSNIAIHSEMEVFMAAIRWLKHDWPDREKWALTVMSSVRFGLISPMTLSTFSYNHSSIADVEISAVIQMPEIISAMSAAMIIHNIACQHAPKSEAEKRDLNFYGLQKPRQRNWIISDITSNCLNQDYISYESFLEFLEMVKTKGANFWKNFALKDSTSNETKANPKPQKQENVEKEQLEIKNEQIDHKVYATLKSSAFQ